MQYVFFSEKMSDMEFRSLCLLPVFPCQLVLFVTRTGLLYNFLYSTGHKEGSFSIGDTENPTTNWYVGCCPKGRRHKSSCNKSLIKNELFSDAKYILMSSDATEYSRVFLTPHLSRNEPIDWVVFTKELNQRRSQRVIEYLLASKTFPANVKTTWR